MELVLGRCEALDPDARQVTADSGATIAFDLASIDTGGVSRAREMLGEDPRLIPVRPIEALVGQIEARAKASHIAVIGGGAGGVELAFALRNRARMSAAVDVTLVTGDAGVVPNLSSAVRRKVAAEMARQGIRTLGADARIEDGVLYAGEESLEPVDLIIAAIGSSAPDWPRASGLACDAAGFIAVDQHQRSVSHPHILAVGDIAARTDQRVAHSGVHAVHAGPVVAANLRAMAAGGAPSRTYSPRSAHLYLLATGRGEAIASYGAFATQGRWMAKLKHAIDQRWLDTYARLVEG